jgi:hypothetical protein
MLDISDIRITISKYGNILEFELEKGLVSLQGINLKMVKNV